MKSQHDGRPRGVLKKIVMIVVLVFVEVNNHLMALVTPRLR